MQNVTLRNIFGRNANQSSLVDPVDTSGTRSVIMIDNARNVTVENVLAKVGGHPDGPVPIWIRNTGTASNPGGRCGVERGNLDVPWNCDRCRRQHQRLHWPSQPWARAQRR